MMKRQLSMAERVHPYGEEPPPLHYPSVDSDANQHDSDYYKPNDLMHRDQEKGLFRGQYPTVNNNGELNQEAQMATAPPRQHRSSRRRRCCKRCCCCIGASVGTFVVIVGILVLLFFLVLHPKLPKYTITEARISEFSMSNTTLGSGANSSSSIASAIIAAEENAAGTVYLNVNMQLIARMRNPNKKIGIDYREITGKLLYEGVDIGEGSIPPFYQGHRNTTYVGLAMQGRDIALTSALADTLTNTLANEDSIVLHARAITLVRIKIGHWKSHTSKVRVKCSIQLSNPARGSVRLLHDHCTFKLLRLHL